MSLHNGSMKVLLKTRLEYAGKRAMFTEWRSPDGVKSLVVIYQDHVGKSHAVNNYQLTEWRGQFVLTISTHGDVIRLPCLATVQLTKVIKMMSRHHRRGLRDLKRISQLLP